MAIITNKANFPDTFRQACESEYSYKEKRYSVTSILTSPREIILKRRHNHETIQDCSDMVWLIFGTAVHKVMEDVEEDLGIIKEQCVEYKTKNGYTLSGYFDLYSFFEKKVLDWKTASVWKVVHKDYEDYRKQLLMYAVLLRANKAPVTSGELNFFLKDWSKNDKKRDLTGTYPTYPIHKVTFNFSEKEIDDMQEWIEDYFKKIEELEKLSDEELPLCDEEQRKFHKVDTFAVKKKGRKSAIRVFDNEEDAETHLHCHCDYNSESEDNYYIEYRPAEETKCIEYCQASPFCSHFINNYAKFIVIENTGKTRAGFKTREEAREFVSIFNLENNCYIEERK